MKKKRPPRTKKRKQIAALIHCKKGGDVRIPNSVQTGDTHTFVLPEGLSVSLTVGPIRTLR